MPEATIYESGLIGEQGTITLPAELCHRFGFEPGARVILEARAEGILIRRALPPVEIYTPERIAEFILTNTVDAEDYADAREHVRKMGLDPDAIEHYKPPGV